MIELKILDLDLDFFINERATDKKLKGKRRLNKTKFIPWEKKQVKDFLENNCGLNPNEKIPGNLFTHHDELFYFLRSLQEKHNFELQFSIDHVDAHADLGYGDFSFYHISSYILNQPLLKRYYPKIRSKSKRLTSGNFLSFAIACRWISTINYINHEAWFNDLPRFFFKDFDFSSNSLELKSYSPSQMKTLIFYGDLIKAAKESVPLHLEPCVPFKQIIYNNFHSSGNYDFICLTQSPAFTPTTSDDLIPTIMQYVDSNK
ncbi:UPF0489 family protein [Spirosoma pollinicola]|uniref:Uncharacterized protein n=1 Tax=Spirosoma pollinicola TaxID=2057025 RepID=A0A2K8YTD8_9BACT|nr:UPF0489 family protein [Spirosoma pollinicola]AUD00880.1 hypothetical protein CWM47_03045 [Spirosoma pollinicola]